MNASEPTDTALIHQIELGSEDAFVELYRRRQPDVYRFAFAMSKSTAVAQDVTQEVFLNVLQNAGRFDASKGSVRAWLFGCARHVTLDRLRLESRWAPEASEEAPVPCRCEQQVFEQQRLDRLHAEILSLPVEYREAIVLCELEEMSYAECAAALSCPIGTIRSRLHRARAKLAERLKQAAGDEPEPMPNAGEVCS